MKERKNIDRLYQEKFKDFEATPNEVVWRSISAKLREKEQKRPFVSPLWSRIAGIAAVLAIILLIGDWIFPSQTRASIANEEVNENFEDTNFIIAETDNSIPAEETAVKKPVLNVVRTQNSTPSNITEQEPSLTSSTLKRKKISPSTNNIASTSLVANLKEENSQKKKSLFAEIAEQEQKITSNSSRGSFEVKTHAAPIYYGNFGKGNFLDPQFNNNSSEGELTYSYGINIAYTISEKIKIRSGVNKVNMSYNTSGIAYQAMAGPVDISSVAYSQTEVQMSDGSGRSSLSKQPVANSRSVGNVNSGLLNQKMGFIEVPVELEYNLIDRKFELNIIGGASTLFLDENRVSLNSGNVSAIGKAKNLNEISFSTNIGLGLDYNLSEKFKLNFEPMLKYQLNTFSSPSSESQPYYLGVYSGFSFKF